MIDHVGALNTVSSCSSPWSAIILPCHNPFDHLLMSLACCVVWSANQQQPCAWPAQMRAKLQDLSKHLHVDNARWDRCQNLRQRHAAIIWEENIKVCVF